MDRSWNQGKKEPLKYEVRDLVMLKGINFKTRTVSKMPDYKLYGLFQVVKVITAMAMWVTLLRS
jgi:hypothetical protein